MNYLRLIVKIVLYISMFLLCVLPVTNGHIALNKKNINKEVNKDISSMYQPVSINALRRNQNKPFQGCNSKAFPPKESDRVKKHVLNLNLPPKERWSSLITSKRNEIQKLSFYIESLMKSLLGIKVYDFIYQSLPELASTLPSPYYEEIQGVAEAANLSVTHATLYNIFYELFTVCTSIVAQDKDGHIKHGRNLDFGLFLGWDRNNHTWIVAELLRPLVVQLEWQKDGETIFESVSYVGYVGVITAVKKDVLSFSYDERFSWNGGYIGLLEWIIFKDHKQKWVSFLSREVLEKATTFEEAVERFSKPPLLAPVYFILGGTKPGQGIVITRFRDGANVLRLNTTAEGHSSWFLVETNYDHWKNPPFYDDRRTPSIQCLEKAGQKEVSFKMLYNVLSTVPVRNKLTTYTSLINAETGLLETWLQQCPDPCWPW